MYFVKVLVLKFAEKCNWLFCQRKSSFFGLESKLEPGPDSSRSHANFFKAAVSQILKFRRDWDPNIKQCDIWIYLYLECCNLASLILSSNSLATESLLDFAIGRRVALVFLSITPCGFRFNSTSWKNKQKNIYKKLPNVFWRGVTTLPKATILPQNLSSPARKILAFFFWATKKLGGGAKILLRHCNFTDLYNKKQRTKFTFGTNTKHNVPVVQKIMNTDMMTNDASCLSDKTKLMAAPITHIITTL